MDSKARAEHARLVARLDAMERQLANIPSRIGDPAPFYSLTVIGGNTLSSGQAGIKNILPPTSCPADYDPDVDTSYADGWGYGYLGINGVTQPNKVLILNDGSLGTLVESWELYSAGPEALPFGSVLKVFYRGFVR